jgi:hypothetical protein
MTRPQIKLYFFYLNKRKFKELERQAIVMWGYDPKKSKKAEKQRKLAEKWQEDPLFGFPNDVIYLTRPQIEQKLGVTRRFGSRMKPEVRWDRERAEACVGRFGLVARRCSMNDKLWGIYQKARQENVVLNLGDIRRMILIDIKRSRLYPSGWIDDTHDPPGWYIDQLKEKGLLNKIFAEIEEAAKA